MKRFVSRTCPVCGSTELSYRPQDGRKTVSEHDLLVLYCDECGYPFEVSTWSQKSDLRGAALKPVRDRPLPITWTRSVYESLWEWLCALVRR